MSFSNQMAHVKDRVVETLLATSCRPRIVSCRRRCRRTQDVASYVSTTRFGTSLRIGSSRSIEFRGGGSGNRSEEAKASGIPAINRYPARRAMYNQSTTAKYASVKRMTVAIISRVGATAMKASGSETAVVAALKAVTCASPVHVLTATTAPKRSRKKVTAAETALKASSPSRTAKTQASDSNQFNAGQTTQINPANGRKRTKARPG